MATATLAAPARSLNAADKATIHRLAKKVLQRVRSREELQQLLRDIHRANETFATGYAAMLGDRLFDLYLASLQAELRTHVPAPLRRAVRNEVFRIQRREGGQNVFLAS